MDAILNALKIDIHASLRAEEVLHLGPVAITNSNLMAWAAMLILIVFAYFAGRNPQLVPTGAQNVFEYMLELLLTVVENTAGHYARRAFPLIATLFLFIITANYMGMLPGVGTIMVRNAALDHEAAASGGGHVSVAEAAAPAAPEAQEAGAEAHEPELVPLLRSADADVNMTLGMGLIAFFFIHASGIAVHGAKKYWTHEIANPPFLAPVKIAIECFVPVSLSMRLFGNIFGGEMLLTVMAFPVIALPFMALELLFGFIQALIFTLLTLIFTSLAVYVPPGHEGGHGEGHETTHGERAGAQGEPSLMPAHA
jgi:F-type H+-transporting ATPase subunit a